MQPSPAARDPILGIDLGTTNSLVALCDERGPRILGEPHALLPSVVRYEVGEGDRPRAVVGTDARDRAPDFPRQTISSVKRLMGRSLADVRDDLPRLAYEVVKGARDSVALRIPAPLAGPRDLLLSPQEVSADILRGLKALAKHELGHEVRRAVVTVPAYFDDSQRQATRDAARLAGLEVARIVNEPTAAALAYGLGLERAAARNTAPEAVAVYDLGGGTFDVTVLRLVPAQTPGERSFYQVLSTFGDTRLGGDDMDGALVAHVLGRPIDALPPADRARLSREAERVKHELSEKESAEFRSPVDGGEVRAIVTRAEFEALISPLVERTLDCCRRVLADALPHLGESGVGAVVLVGGATRVPLVRARVAEFFGLEPYTALDPDRVIALGAAVQGAILSGSLTGALLLDVVPLSLGIETMGGAVAKLILRNSAVPARAVERFSTAADNQTSFRIAVYQGEREMAADCRKLAEFHLRGFPPMPAGIPQLEVEFLVDANGVLNVAASERRSGKRASLQVVPNHGLTREEVDRLEAEAFAHAREDMTRHRITDLCVNARLDLKWIGERLERFRAQLDPNYSADLDARITELRRLVEAAERDWAAADPGALHRAKEELDHASIRLQEVGIAASLREE